MKKLLVFICFILIALFFIPGGMASWNGSLWISGDISSVESVSSSNVAYTLSDGINGMEANIAESYTVSLAVVPEGYGFINGYDYPGEAEFDAGEQVELVAIAYEGYRFDGWVEDGYLFSADPYYAFRVEQDRELFALFSAIEKEGEESEEPGSPDEDVDEEEEENGEAEEEIVYHTVTIQVEPEGSGEIDGFGSETEIKVASGDTLELEAIPKEGYIFTGWFIDGELLTQETLYQSPGVANPYLLVAEFALIEEDEEKENEKIKEPWEKGNSGDNKDSDVPDEDAGQEGGESEEPDAPDEDIDEEEEENGETEEEIVYHTVTMRVEPEGSGEIFGFETDTEIEVASGDTLELEAIPNEGYIFTGWTEDDQLVSEENIYIFTVENNRSLVATFSIVGTQDDEDAPDENGENDETEKKDSSEADENGKDAEAVIPGKEDEEPETDSGDKSNDDEKSGDPEGKGDGQ